MTMTHPVQTWKPTLYDSRAAFVSEFGADLVGWLAPARGERILDLGCGTGTLGAAIAEKGAVVTGADASTEMILEARQKYPSLAWKVEDGQALPYEAEFDAVFSNAALHWMPRADDVARGIARALVPGGRFVAEFGGAGCVSAVRDAVTHVLREWNLREDAWMPWYFPSIPRYATVLESAGLEPTLLHLFPRPTRMEGDDGLGDWLRLFGASLLTDLGDRAAAFTAAVAERCAPTLYRDGGWVLDYVRIRVAAKKA